jgi:hypothetical protein
MAIYIRCLRRWSQLAGASVATLTPLTGGERKPVAFALESENSLD